MLVDFDNINRTMNDVEYKMTRITHEIKIKLSVSNSGDSMKAMISLETQKDCLLVHLFLYSYKQLETDTDTDVLFLTKF